MYVHCNFGDYVSVRFLLSLQACMTRRFFLWAFSMHGSFISFTKPKLKICVLLKTSSEITSLSRVIISCVLIETSSEVTSVLGWQFSWSGLLVLSEILMSKVPVLRVLVLRILVSGELVSRVLVLAVLVPKIPIPKLLLTKVLALGVSVLLSTQKCTCNPFESWK